MNYFFHKTIFNKSTGLKYLLFVGLLCLSQITFANIYNTQNISGNLNTDLTAKNNINIKSFKETESNRSNNQASGLNAGVTLALGAQTPLTLDIGANHSKGHENADSTTHRNSHIGSQTGQTNISTGEMLKLKGGQIQGKGISISAKDLNIESQQDTETYHSRQQNASGSVTFTGFIPTSGNLNAGQSKINADYASVNEQSGIFAGDDGYQINIKNHTDLTGGIITSTQTAEDNGKNQFTTGSLNATDIQNHALYKGESFAVGIGANYNGEEVKVGSNGIGYGNDSDSHHSITKSGINTANIIITNKEQQQALTGKSVEETIANIKTDVSTDNYTQYSGSLNNNFDADRVQSEIDLQREVTQEFDRNRQLLRAEINQKADENRKDAEDIRREKNGYNTAKSLDLDKQADKLEKVSFYTDLALGGLYGLGSTDALTYAVGSAAVNPVVRAATRPRQFWQVKCNGDSLYCSNTAFDDKTLRKLYDEQGKEIDTKDSNYIGKVEIGDKRQIFDLSEIRPEDSIITKSNNGILNPLNDALKNATKQNSWDTNKNDGVLVIYNAPTGNPISELLYAAYDKTNDLLLGSRFLSFLSMPLTSAQKANLELNQYAADNAYKIDSSNHSRGGLTESIVTKYSLKERLPLPYNEVRFFGTATNVKDYKKHTEKFNQDFNVLSAVNETDFVGRTPMALFRTKYLLGGNEPTGGQTDNPYRYTHSDYYMNIPDKYMVNEYGHYMDGNGNLLKDNNGNVVKRDNNKDGNMYPQSVDAKEINPHYTRFDKSWDYTKGEFDKKGINPSAPKSLGE